MGLESLAHFEIAQGRVGEGSDALCICRTHRDLWILDEISEVWDDVLGKDGDVGWGDDGDLDQLGANEYARE